MRGLGSGDVVLFQQPAVIFIALCDRCWSLSAGKIVFQYVIVSHCVREGKCFQERFPLWSDRWTSSLTLRENVFMKYSRHEARRSLTTSKHLFRCKKDSVIIRMIWARGIYHYVTFCSTSLCSYWYTSLPSCGLDKQHKMNSKQSWVDWSFSLLMVTVKPAASYQEKSFHVC